MPKDPYALLRALMRAEAARGERAATEKATPPASPPHGRGCAVPAPDRYAGRRAGCGRGSDRRDLQSGSGGRALS